MSYGDPNTPALPPPGWYADPSNPALERWWAGPSWTEHVRELPAPVYQPPAPVYAQQWGNPEVPTYAGFESTPAIPAAPAAEPYSPMASAYGSSYAGPYSQTGNWQVELGSPNTIPIWLIATFPAMLVVISLARLLLPLDVSRSLSVPITLAVYAFYIGMAFWDHAELKRRGHDAASPAWVFLTVLAYLIARRIVLKRSGITHNAPGNVFGGLILLGIVGAIASVALLAASL